MQFSKMPPFAFRKKKAALPEKIEPLSSISRIFYILCFPNITNLAPKVKGKK